ncbi:MAG: hypothetical protein ACI4XF_07675 [Oscillospiraceae bacterium]
MLKCLKKFDNYFDIKKKKKYSLICLGIVVLWILLWITFPMEFYSLFFDSAAGSNVMLLIMELVIMIPANLLFSRILKANISMSLTFIEDIVCMTAAAYTFSIFRYDSVWWVILTIAVHFVTKLFTDGFAYEDKDTVIPLLRRKPLNTALTALAHTAVLDGVFLVLMYTAAQVFAG